MNNQAIVAEAKRIVTAAIADIDNLNEHGMAPHRYFRPQYGDVDARIRTIKNHGFEFLGNGFARVTWLLTIYGKEYAIKFDRLGQLDIDMEHQEGQRQDEPESAGNLADWCAQTDLLNVYPQLATNLAIILGGFDCQAGLVLVQEYAPVDRNLNVMDACRFKPFLRMINALARDVECNVGNFSIVNDTIKVVDLDRLSYKRLTSPRAAAAVRDYYKSLTPANA
jgi:hypothetical protein